MGSPIPPQLKNKKNQRVLDYLRPLSCHSDIVIPLERCFENMQGVRSFCPEPRQFRYCLWYTGDVVFAFAAGMQKVGLKLPAEKVKSALSVGGQACAEAGREWIAFSYNDHNLCHWATQAYLFTRQF